MNHGWRWGILRGTAAPSASPVVMKVGGSLLARTDWAREVATLLDTVALPRVVVVVGGGPLVDGLRAIDRAAPQPAALVHRLAIDCMGITARLAAAALALPLTTEPRAVGPRAAVLDAPGWLNHAGRADRLPIGWQVTSDSIAALVAAEFGAGLVLLKSVPPPRGADLARLAAAGWVDDWFPHAAAPLAHVAWAAPA